MSTSENPETPPLTRRQLRELRNTGATPIITPQLDADEAVSDEPGTAPDATASSAATPAAPEVPSEAQESPTAEPESAVAEPDESGSAHEPPAKKGGMFGGLFGRNKAETATVDEAPVVDVEPAPAPVQPIVPASFPPVDGPDLGVTGLTRRQARAQERIRTASVPIIAPDLQPGVPGSRDEPSEIPAPTEDAPDDSAEHATVPAEQAEIESAQSTDETDQATDSADESSPEDVPAIFRPAAPDEEPAADTAIPLSTVNPALGSDLLSGQTPKISLPPSFDQLIARSATATGSVATPNALILSQTPAGVPLVGPVTSTGEVLITGTFELPEGLGSAGHAPGTTDGRDVDAVLLDGELPPASSPTPIAASAAISTVKQPGEIIRPPAPEKGSKLVIGLIITTGALAVAVAVALVLAFTTGVFG
ncbi:MAG: hypothetical protein BGO45_09625 [Microbacterium sp. 71-36]|uniref:hypothetical protein n=1 Tax=unclassified Microbacterium TaxID=2609290 RepID=UPI0008691BD9|nr:MULTISPECIES: hypothetical protein [unclassified Microbacterium]MBN9211953.1 hypothetical protein [Microbacterium sp.]ODT38876.1 MAG: hypothetical protein ABS60_08690 [Microbacterium sp. SCN 71-17]ODU52090.1 MAG: hypothetical protein ABT07_01610 [Microbacterium sp. SCN 70-10]OJV77067.1 MAG: hypothetical protein BGO45_09625 [Microbacterium sp. 71-36]